MLTLLSRIAVCRQEIGCKMQDSQHTGINSKGTALFNRNIRSDTKLYREKLKLRHREDMRKCTQP